jgi:NAD(P)-dependent dehydrogenase (short-subunit alcohol dehydrogenase family)
MAGRLAGKVAIVTSAGSSGPGMGNGKATAILFARVGAKVLCVDQVLGRAEEAVAAISGEGGVSYPLPGRRKRARRLRRGGPGRGGPLLASWTSCTITSGSYPLRQSGRSLRRSGIA